MSFPLNEESLAEMIPVMLMRGSVDAEHHVLYQVNINNAKNVFIGLQQGEAAYWQGTGNKLLAPEPWTSSLLPSDPDFSWCAPDAELVRSQTISSLF